MGLTGKNKLFILRISGSGPGQNDYLFTGPTKRATERDRTADLLITNQLLYQLSYGGLGNHNLWFHRQNSIEIFPDTIPVIK